MDAEGSEDVRQSVLENLEAGFEEAELELEMGRVRGWVHWREVYLAQLDRAMELLEESLALSREAGSIRGAAHSLWALGVTYMMGGELDRATELLEEALTLWRASGDPAIIAGILTHLGHTMLLQGDIERATAVSEEAASMLRERTNRNHYLAEGPVENLGWAALLQGSSEQAKALFAESLGLRQELGDKLTTPNTLEALASAAAA